MGLYQPLDAWQRMDNYWAHFLEEHPHLDPSFKEKISHFRIQYLLKVSNFCPQEALLFQIPLSPWNSPLRGDYHRLYHANRLLGAMEEELGKGILDPQSRLFVLGKQERMRALLNQVRKQGGYWQKTLQESGFQEQFFTLHGIDVLVVSPSQQEVIEAWMGEWGLTPSLQEACRMAAQLQLFEPHSVYEFPEQKGAPSSWASFFEDPVYKQFQTEKADVWEAKVLCCLLEGFQKQLGEELFQRSPWMSDSCGRILHAFEVMHALDIRDYASKLAFEQKMDLIYEEMLLWAMLFEPYPVGELEKAIAAYLPQPSFVKSCSSGMGVFATILQSATHKESVLLVFEGGYYENRSVLLKSYPEENIYLVRAPDYASSLKKNLESIARQQRQVDLVFLNLHENILKGRWVSEETPVFSFLQEILDAGCASSSLIVVLDTTIGHFQDPQIQKLLDYFRAKGVQFFLFWSHQKFDLLGIDKGSGGTLCFYGEDQALLQRLQENKTDSIDFVSRQLLSHFFLHAFPFLEERRVKIFANASFVYQLLDKNLLLDPQKKAQSVCLVEKRDPYNFSIDVQCDRDREEEICQAFHKRGIPVLTRSGFGFNLTSVAFTRFHMARFSIGLEERPLLTQFAQAFNEIFHSFC